MVSSRRNPSSQDADLLQRARRLEESALALIFDTYYQPLYRYIYHHLGHAPTAEDLTAEVFRRFLEALHSGHGPDDYLQAWLYRVAHNLVVDELRRRRRQEHEALKEGFPDSAATVGTQVQQALTRQAVRQALQALSPQQRAVLILKYLEGMENAEIAQALHLREGAVRALQHRGLRALERYLKRHGLMNLEDV
jgi:RNA polymerase sigma-70 factor (ECF subfamily)